MFRKGLYMEVTGIVVNQVIIMFLLMAVGIILVKKNIVTPESTRSLCNLLLILVLPAAIVHSYYTPFEADKAWKLAMAFGLSILFHLIAIIVSRLLVKKDQTNEYRIRRLAVVYSNCGFMGFPLLAALLGQDGIFYGTAFIAVFNVIIWIEGIKTLKEGQKLGLRKAILNPGCIAVFIGLFIYLTGIPIPAPVVETVGYLGSMNTPLAMLITGIFLAEVSVKAAARDTKAIAVGLIKTLVMPLLFLLVMMIIRAADWVSGGADVCIAVLMAAACPSAASIILIPASLKMSGSEGAKLLAISTIMSMVTLPLISSVVYLVFK